MDPRQVGTYPWALSEGLGIEKEPPSSFVRGGAVIKGLEPENEWKLKRFNDVKEAIKRYVENCLPIPDAWLKEYEKLRQDIIA